MRAMPSLKMPAFCVGSAALVVVVCHIWVNRRQPQPYMDELFHIPQAQEFCSAAIGWKWPKYHTSITTPPGLYIPNALLAGLIRSSRVCRTSWLRASSAVYALICLVLQYLLLRQLRIRRRSIPGRQRDNENIATDEEEHSEGWLLAFGLWLNPVFLFYAHMYYTDTASLFWVLLTWYMSLTGKVTISAISGVLATMTRQTNMIWHGFVVVDRIVHDAALSVTSNMSFPALLKKLGLQAIRSNRVNLLAGLAYLMFVVQNQGIAIGDKSNHEASLHFAMFAYFLGFHTISYAQFQLSRPRHLLLQVRSLATVEVAGFFLSTCMGLAALVFATGDKVHPFTLSDNRHFVFYVYRRWLLRSSLRRVSLVPVYAWSLLSLYVDLKHGKQHLLKAPARTLKERRLSEYHIYLDYATMCLLFSAAFVTLVPAPLLEPRYFIVAGTLVALQRLSAIPHTTSREALWLLLIGIVGANLGLVYVFAEMPFERPPDAHMPEDLSPGRFML